MNQKSSSSPAPLFIFGLALTAGWFAYPHLPPLVETSPVVVEEATSSPEPTISSKPTEPAAPAPVEITPRRTPAEKTVGLVRTTPTKPVLDDAKPGVEGHVSNGPGMADLSKIYEGVLPLDGKRRQTSAQKGFEVDLIRYTIKSDNWTAYQQLLERSLQAAMQGQRLGRGRDRYDGLWETPAFDSALIRWKCLACFSTNTWARVADAPGGDDFLMRLLQTRDWQEEILLTLKPQDRPERVLEFLVTAWASHEGDHTIAAKYFNLALGCAVVFDEEVRLKNPTSAGSMVDGMERYQWYIQQNEKGLTEAPIDRTPARDLAFVVCSPVSTAELEWAARKLRSLSRRNWGDAYGMVEYLMERAVDGVNPYESYILSEILKEGGICGDQTYFCVNTARAVGIPALGLSGITDSGGHAWAAVKIQDDEWSTSIGRIGGVSKGTGRDPQTGETLTEQAIWQWNHRKYQRRELWGEVQRHFWLANLLGPSEEAFTAVDTAWKLAPEFPEVWRKVYKSLLQRGQGGVGEAPTQEAWEDFSKDLRREFRDNPRMAGLATEIEEKHLFPKLDLNDIRRLLARERRRIESEAAEQADLLVEMVERERFWICERLDGEEEKKEIARLYTKSLRDYGSSVTAFRSLSDAYFNYAKDDPELAKDAVGDIASAFDREIDTNSGDWFRAKTEAGLHRYVAGLYRQIGEVKKAERIEGRIEREMKQKKRKAR